jgi:DNA polymerase-3 subunit gamma/tau
VAAAEGLAVDDDALALLARSADGGMRDGLSLLDQVTAFGEGPVTAARVRELLGLIPDDVYGEVLRLVAERDARAVFPLVDRLAEAGADLGEFVAGAGDALRAVLQVSLGGEPEGLTEAMQEIIKQYCSGLPAPDVVRLLTVLGTMEPQLRTSGHPRLVVELLLLRWAMMDRTVEIQEVLRALDTAGSGEGGAVGGGSAGGAARAPVLRDVGTPTPEESGSPPASSRVPAPRSPERGPLTVERFRSLWPSIVTHARATSPLVGTLLADAVVQSVTSDVVALAAPAPQSEGLAHKRDAIARLLGEWSERPVRVVVTTQPQGSGSTEQAPPPRPARLTQETANAERLKVLRAKDPTLGEAVDALDLELME